MTLPLSSRAIFAWVAASSAGLMAFALYLQHALNEIPCPLCISQRIFVIAIGVVALLAAIINPQAMMRRVTSGLLLVLAIVGAGIAGRHVWLQSLPPDQVPACGPGLGYMFENFPLQKALELLFMGNGNCAEQGWTFLTLGIPAWTLICFALYGLIALYQLLRR